MSPATPESGKITTHERILRVSKSLFANRGYEHTSTSAIARQAGTSESQLMKHFGNKAGLLEAIFVEGWTQITDDARVAIRDATSPLVKLQTISGCVLRSLERDPELKLLLLLEGRRIRKEGQMVALTQGFLGFVQLIDGVLYEMRDANILRPGLSPQAVRSALMGMLEGMLRDRFLADRLGFPADFNLQQLQEMLTCVLGSFIVSPQQRAAESTPVT
jgi:AcrR family transcriptional regulator